MAATSPLRNVVFGALAAMVIAGLLIAASAGLAGNAWKYLLAAIGLVLFILAGLGKDAGHSS